MPASAFNEFTVSTCSATVFLPMKWATSHKERTAARLASSLASSRVNWPSIFTYATGKCFR